MNPWEIEDEPPVYCHACGRVTWPAEGCACCGKITCKNCLAPSGSSKDCPDCHAETHASLGVPQSRRLDGLELIGIPFSFSAGTINIPALNDPKSGERFYSADAVQIMYSLTHDLTPLKLSEIASRTADS